MFPALPRPKVVKKMKMEEKEVEAVKVEKKKALLVKRHINTGKGEKEEKATKEEEVGRKIDAEVEKKKVEKKKADVGKKVEKKKADLGKKVEKRKETQKRKNEEKKTAGDWTKVDSKGFPLVTVYPSVPKKRRTQTVPDGERFQTIKKTPKSKVKRNDSPTPEEREEMVLRNNPFWIPKNNSDLFSGAGNPISQLDGNVSFSESEDDEVAEVEKRVAVGRKGVAKQKKRGLSKGEGVAKKKVLVVLGEEVEKIVALSSSFSELETETQNRQNTGTPQNTEKPQRTETLRYTKTPKHTTSKHNTGHTTSSGGEEERKKSCPLCNNFSSSNVAYMKKHLQRHTNPKLSKKKILEILEMFTIEEISPRDIQRGIDEMQLEEEDLDQSFEDLSGIVTYHTEGCEDEEMFSGISDSEEEKEEEEPALNPLPSYAQKIAKLDKETELAKQRMEKLTELRQLGNEQLTSRITSLAILQPLDLAERILQETRKAKENDELMRKETEELAQQIRRNKARKSMKIVLQNQQNSRTAVPTMTLNETSPPDTNTGPYPNTDPIPNTHLDTPPQTSQDNQNTDMGNGGTDTDLDQNTDMGNGGTDTDLDIDMDTDTETNPHTDPTPHTHLDTTATPPHTSQNNSDTDMGNGGTATNTEPDPTPRQQHPDTVKRKRNEKVDQAECPICLKKLCRKSALKDHLQTQHKGLTKSGIDDILKTVKHTTETCFHCNTSQGNLSRHLLVCKKKKATEERKKKLKLEKQMKKQGLDNDIITEQKSIPEMLDDFYNHMDNAKSTRKMYTRTAKTFLEAWELDPRFEAHKLLSPIEHKITYPTITGILNTTTQGSKLTLCKAYIQFSKFILSQFNKKYNNSDKFHTWEKNTFRQEVRFAYGEVSTLISGLNRTSVANTQTNKALSRKDDSILKHQPKRCLELYMHLQNSNTLKAHLTLLTKGSPQEIEEHGFDECNFRKLLLGLLTVFGGGQRPHAAARMTIQEFKDAKTVNDIQRVLVADNKTKNKYGPCSMLFTLPGLYAIAACQRYHTLFKTETPSSHFLFSTQTGNEMELGVPMDFLAENYLQNIIKESEKKHFIPRIWRTYWSNINRSAKEQDQGVYNAGLEMMAHCESTDEGWYTEKPERAETDTLWARKMKERMEEIMTNPNTVIEDHSEEILEEENTEDHQSVSDTQNMPASKPETEPETEPETDPETDPKTDHETEPLVTAKNSSIQEKDRQTFRTMLKPSKEKHNLPNQIEK